MDDLGLEVYTGPPGRKTGAGPPDLLLDRAKPDRDVGADLIFGDRPATGVGSDLIFGSDRPVALEGNPKSVGQTPRSAADDSLGELLRGDHRPVDTGLVFIRIVSGKFKGAWFTLDVSGSTTVSQVQERISQRKEAEIAPAEQRLFIRPPRGAPAGPPTEAAAMLGSAFGGGGADTVDGRVHLAPSCKLAHYPQLRLLEYAAVTTSVYNATEHGPSTIYVRDTLSAHRREASRHRAALLANKRRNDEKRHAVGVLRKMTWPDGRVSFDYNTRSGWVVVDYLALLTHTRHTLRTCHVS